MSSKPQTPPGYAVSTTSAIALNTLGITCTLLSGLLDGFFSGLLLGVGIVLIVAGAVALGTGLRRTARGDAEPAESSDSWLPSRDGDR